MKEKTKRHISRRAARIDDDDAQFAVFVGGMTLWILIPLTATAILPDLGDFVVLGVCYGLPLSLAGIWLLVIWCALAKRIALKEFRQWQNSRLFVKKDETDD